MLCCLPFLGQAVVVSRLTRTAPVRLPGRSTRLEDGGEAGAAAELGDAHSHRARPRLPATVAAAVALHQPLGAALAMPAPLTSPHLQLHQALGGEGMPLPAFDLLEAAVARRID